MITIKKKTNPKIKSAVYTKLTEAVPFKIRPTLLTLGYSKPQIPHKTVASVCQTALWVTYTQSRTAETLLTSKCGLLTVLWKPQHVQDQAKQM
jgi:hypothetical protein